MPFSDLIESIRIYYPALLLDDVVEEKVRATCRTVFGFLTGLLIVVVLFTLFYKDSFLAPYTFLIQPLFFIIFAIWLDILLLSAFYNFYYFKDIIPVIKEGGLEGGSLPLTFAVAQIVYHTEDDVTAGFARSPQGQHIFKRLGLDYLAVAHFLSSRKNRLLPNGMMFPGGVRVTLLTYARAVFGADKELSQFLFSLGVQEKEYVGAATWVEKVEERRKRFERFWGKDVLGRIPSIGRTWSYGQIFTLQKYAEEFTFGIPPSESGVSKEIDGVESVLARNKGANAMIVAESGSGELNIVYGLVEKIKKGTVLPPLEGKKIFRVMGGDLVDAFPTKQAFENEFVKIMDEAVHAGNIIILFQDMPGFVENTKNVGSDLASLLYPYLTSQNIQIIGIADRFRFHERIENNTALMNSFEVVRLEERDTLTIIALLEEEVFHIERGTGLFFTYQALEAVAESAERYFTEGVLLDKARDILAELPAKMKKEKRYIVTKNDVLSLVETKSGVPQEGMVKAAEKDKLLNLERVLEGRIIGQHEAIVAIANAMRRARAGLRNPGRPIGSFLFLGPTGVGKTETAKVLSEVFFGLEAPMLRLNMFEYAGEGALARLVGSFESGKPGALASLLRDHKYGVLLLDEFEKTSPEVLNMFLQILDEGVFTDMVGKKVNARNVIIIATSNAGSDLIFELVGSGKNIESAKDTIIETIIKNGTFKPELVNRFDDVILFHPLQESDLKSIARLLIQKLGTRLKEQGIRLNVTDDLVAFVAKGGFDQKFGARPMNRVLQDHVEKLLAEKLIRGEIQKGATVEVYSSHDGLDSLAIREVGV